MKRYLICLILFVVSLSTFSQSRDTSQGPKIIFEKYNHDFGDIVQGDSVFYVFKFTNTGTDTLVVVQARANCGCTPVILDTDKKYAPGETGELKVGFRSEGKSGIINRDVTILSNAVNAQPLGRVFIRVNIIPSKDASSASKSSSKKK